MKNVMDSVRKIYIWVEEVSTKKIVYGYVGTSSAQELWDLICQYGSKPEYELFQSWDNEGRVTYWWNEQSTCWTRCNWTCKPPEDLEMKILLGAI